MHPYLRLAISATSAISETTLLFFPWIFSPPSNAHLATIELPPSWAAGLIFALLDPIFTLLMRYWPILPFVGVGGSAMLHVFTVDAAQRFGLTRQSTSLDEKELAQDHEEDDHPKTGRLSRPAATFTSWLPVLTAALSNASLLNLSKAVMCPTNRTVEGLTIFMWAFSFAIRLTDYALCEDGQRPVFLGYGGIDVARSQLQNIFMVFVARSAVRVALGMPALGFMEMMDEAEATRLFGLQRYQHISSAVISWLPPWLSIVGAILGLVLQIVSFWVYPGSRRG